MREVPVERVLRALARLGEADATMLASRLGGDSERAAASASRALELLVSAGVVVRRGARVQFAPARGLFPARVRCTPSQRCFVSPLFESGEEAHVPGSARNGALHGDLVIARVARRGRGRPEAEILSVLERVSPRVIGRFEDATVGGAVYPFDARTLLEVGVGPADLGGARAGDVVVAEVGGVSADGRSARGRVVEVLGRPGDPGLDVAMMLRRHGLPHVFPAPVTVESEAIPAAVREQDVAGRLDLRDVPTVTIDGETARDFDDAITIEPLGERGWLLGVHIADVGHYVRHGSALDEEARLRGTSVYFPDRAVPMLPERLSNGICSLKPRVDRLALSARMTIDTGGCVTDYWLGPTVIRSDERMTYDAVHELLTVPDGPAAERYAALAPRFREMERLARALVARRESEGAIDFDLPQAVVEHDVSGRVLDIRRAARTIAHRIVEQFMLTANETVARHLTTIGMPMIYRIHEQPDPRKVDEFVATARAFGHGFTPGTPPSPKDFQWLAKRIAGMPEERMLSSLMLQSLRRARYATANLGHFGLASACYCHFTSPIRRYPDLVVHRALRESLERGVPGTPEGARSAPRPLLPLARTRWLEGLLEVVADESSERERAAAGAEDEMIRWKRADYLAERLGDELDAIVVGVRESGLNVELEEAFIEGFVHVSSLPGDSYMLRESLQSLVGRQTGVAFRLGDRVTVRVDRVDRNREEMEFSVVLP